MFYQFAVITLLFFCIFLIFIIYILTSTSLEIIKELESTKGNINQRN